MDALKFLEEVSDDRISDVHLINKGDEGEVYVRKSGEYLFQRKLEKENFRILMQQIKVLSGMDIGEKRLPQDGILILGDKRIRSSTINTVKGESAVLRFYNKKVMEIDSLGFSLKQVEVLHQLLSSAFSVIMISGGTGSGKSTTLKSILKHVSMGGKKIISIEDPVEIHIPEIVEVNVSEDIGFNYETAIFSAMRQDPDCISIGEIRDSATVKALLKASLSGHGIISTIHSDDYLTTLRRLEVMSDSSFFSEVLTCVINQKLIKEDNNVMLSAKIYLKEGNNINVY